METLDLPVIGETEEAAAVPVDFAEQEMDIAAFKLWHDACVLNAGDDEEAAEPAASKAES